MEANNNAAMRDALDKARRVLHCAIVAGFLKGDDAYDAVNMANAALAEPPRNCDVGTAEEQIERFDEFCNAQCSNDGRDCDTCPLFNSWKLKDNCQIIWAQMPYKEGGAK